jgi:hypothetical protein
MFGWEMTHGGASPLLISKSSLAISMSYTVIQLLLQKQTVALRHRYASSDAFSSLWIFLAAL